MKLLSIFLFLLILFPHLAPAGEDYSFDLSEIEKEIGKKPYGIGGYLEFRPNFFWLDKDSAFYKLKFDDLSGRSQLDEYNFRLLLDADYERGIARLFLKTVADVKESDWDADAEAKIFEGYASLKPFPFFSTDLGKKTFNWGTGYAWNPVDFVGRPQDPDDPDLPLEGFLTASADYIKSFEGPLKTLALTPVFIPVYENINEDFGKIEHVNFGGKAYFLFHDTDIDVMFLTEGSKSGRFGLDFSRNITTNFEIHGEFAFINNFKKPVIDSDGKLSEKTFDAKSFLLGIRYLTSSDTTFISEYYRNGTGYSKNEVEDFFAFVHKGHDAFVSSGDEVLLKRAASLGENNYGKRNPMQDYFYLRIVQKEPFDMLYFSPSITWIYNISDKSYSLSPQFLYTGITNLELRLKGAFIVGAQGTEYGEKQNDYRLEFRARYYFDAVKLFDRIKRRVSGGDN